MSEPEAPPFDNEDDAYREWREAAKELQRVHAIYTAAQKRNAEALNKLANIVAPPVT